MAPRTRARSAQPRTIEYMPLSAIRRAAVNPKRHDAAGIAASVDRFGVIEVITLDERTGQLVSGHGRLDDLEARRAKGDDPPDGVIAGETEWEAPVVRGWASVDDDDAVAAATFLSPAYLEAKVAELEAKAGAPVSHPAEAIKTIGRALSFTDEQVNGVLEHFIQGGQLTAGGVLNAVTSFAQVVEDGDEAAVLEAAALRAFDLAVAVG